MAGTSQAPATGAEISFMSKIELYSINEEAAKKVLTTIKKTFFAAPLIYVCKINILYYIPLS